MFLFRDREINDLMCRHKEIMVKWFSIVRPLACTVFFSAIIITVVA